MFLPVKSIALLAVVTAVIVIAPKPAIALFKAPDEEEMGRKADEQIVHAYGLYDDEKLQAYVRKVGKRVLAEVVEPQYEYHFKLMDDAMVNAFALPGGYIYVTRGLLAVLNSEAALAGVIGHEIGHVIGHHAVKKMKKSIGQTLLALGGLIASKDIRANAGAWLTITTSLSQQILLGYGRDMEMESDQEGLILTHEAGYDPHAIVGFLQSLRTLEKLGGRGYHGFQATHPDTIVRIIQAEEKAGILSGRGKDYQFYRDRYLDMIEGLRYGRPKWHGKTLPPYKIHIYTVKKGDTFRSIAEDVSGNQALALEMATLNAMDHNDALTPGMRIKTLVEEKSSNRILERKHKKEKKDEVSAGTGDGKIGKTGRREKADKKSEKSDR
ncbi:MAG TPA: LysM peptidoglycan-binding domain-containing protein [Nitrospirae bacterium]|nr:LysM peptidoglycan-binding domain-containing protein [Nitrospirota bacterium]